MLSKIKPMKRYGISSQLPIGQLNLFRKSEHWTQLEETTFVKRFQDAALAVDDSSCWEYITWAVRCDEAIAKEA